MSHFRIPDACISLADVAACIADRMNVAAVHIEVKDRDWGIADVFKVDGMDLIYIGRLADDHFEEVA